MVNKFIMYMLQAIECVIFMAIAIILQNPMAILTCVVFLILNIYFYIKERNNVLK